ncbi:protein NEGATIVE REGULATOR OF RESISTANCE-like [Lolium rigidum]|uniref:protein NEGATIVE REGULATOR OF RESISTANCE-like n=1 Tax=Lolium rigidum TaxID=89674 RepID=UPI001F5C3066|nr:protein NEGATIVE REGULATOR OF RESISTANCE-like [Lolium rigidum]
MDPPTTAGKRKRPAAAAATVDEVSDADVEEFCAILRRHHRMRDAYRRPVSGARAGAQAPTHVPAPWRPSFSMADFAQPAPTPAAVPALRQQQLPVAGNATPPRRPASIALDLNAEPEPQEPPTPRPERDQA